MRGRPGRAADRDVLRQGPAEGGLATTTGSGPKPAELGLHRRFDRRLLRAEDRACTTRERTPPAAGLSAVLQGADDPTTGDLFHGNKKLKNRADLLWTWTTCRAPDASLLVTSSKQGEANYKDTLKFIEQVKAKQPTRISSIILDSGGHNFNTWRREIPPTLEWISGRLSDR